MRGNRDCPLCTGGLRLLGGGQALRAFRYCTARAPLNSAHGESEVRLSSPKSLLLSFLLLTKLSRSNCGRVPLPTANTGPTQRCGEQLTFPIHRGSAGTDRRARTLHISFFFFFFCVTLPKCSGRGKGHFDTHPPHEAARGWRGAEFWQ